MTKLRARSNNLKTGVTSGAARISVVLPDLQDDFTPLSCAIWTYKMRWQARALWLLVLIDNCAPWGGCKRVVRQVIIKRLERLKLTAERGQLLLKGSVRNLRIRYLVSNLGQNAFDIRVSTRLRFFEKALEGCGKADKTICGPGSGINGLDNFAKVIGQINHALSLTQPAPRAQGGAA